MTYNDLTLPGVSSQLSNGGVHLDQGQVPSTGQLALSVQLCVIL
jgi:hypothetical protein